MEDYRKLFIENAHQIMSDFKRDFALLKSGSDMSSQLNNIHRYAHSLKGLSAMMKFNKIYSVSNELEITLNKLINGTLDLDKNIYLKIKHGFAKIERLLENGRKKDNPFG